MQLTIVLLVLSYVARGWTVLFAFELMADLAAFQTAQQQMQQEQRQGAIATAWPRTVAVTVLPATASATATSSSGSPPSALTAGGAGTTAAASTYKRFEPSWFTRHRSLAQPAFVTRLFAGITLLILAAVGGASAFSRAPEDCSVASQSYQQLCLAILFTLTFCGGVVVAVVGWRLRRHGQENFGLKTE